MNTSFLPLLLLHMLFAALSQLEFTLEQNYFLFLASIITGNFLWTDFELKDL